MDSSLVGSVWIDFCLSISSSVVSRTPWDGMRWPEKNRQDQTHTNQFYSTQRREAEDWFPGLFCRSASRGRVQVASAQIYDKYSPVGSSKWIETRGEAGPGSGAALDANQRSTVTRSAI